MTTTPRKFQILNSRFFGNLFFSSKPDQVIFLSQSKCFCFPLPPRGALGLKVIIKNLLVYSMRKGENVFLTATYNCDENFALAIPQQNRMYCSNDRWIGTTPACISTQGNSFTDSDGKFSFCCRVSLMNSGDNEIDSSGRHFEKEGLVSIDANDRFIFPFHS